MKTTVAFKTPKGKTEVLKAYDSLAEGWMQPNEKMYIDTRFGKAYVIATGRTDAPPLILLHGSAMNSVMWLKDAQEYSAMYRVYAIDLPGEPGRSSEEQLPFLGKEFAEWLLDVYESLSLQRASLIGISLGAWLAVKFAVNYPDKVDKLVLLCPAGIGPQRTSFLFKMIGHMLLGEKGMDLLYKKVNGNRPIPEVIQNYQKLIGKNFNYRRETIPLYKDEELRRLSMPLLLLVGEKDIMLHSDITAERISKLLPQADVTIIPGAGHTLVNLTDRIQKFLIVSEK
ncbi:alpha/beta hydrolase [Anaerocolumna sp. AGMB13025]|uniref:alpha/beta fold hydrolase n=1 Tax=Anaerocolumna sp. AGMB13025 TaxID=3039116 RepID=UPI0024204E5F|nr:alpha/beta hydrolase [Anaerocolumna sp. AGMB13025]WFR55494.1 alpha/beta hydrolase [Anaerocolumna sp. AGMB13025]